MTKKIYNLTGLGNGLVDLQYKLSFEKLSELGLTKGSMVMVSPEEQSRMLNLLANEQAFRSSGGSAANSIIAFAKFGGSAAYFTVLGDDDFGKFYADEFREIGIELNAEMLSSDPTGICLVLITPDADRTMYTSLGATAKFGLNNLSEEIIAKSEWLYLEGYEFTTQNGADACFVAAQMAKQSHTKLSLTFSDAFVTEHFHSALEKAAVQCDLIFCNEAEAISFTHTSDIDSAINQMQNVAPAFVITLGNRGSIAYFDKELYKFEANQVTPLDTTGAGDMFAGAFFYGLMRHNSIEKAGLLASLASSKVVSRLGARYDGDHHEFMKQLGL